nr:hypothetical protein [uncultured bacterium]
MNIKSVGHETARAPKPSTPEPETPLVSYSLKLKLNPTATNRAVSLHSYQSSSSTAQLLIEQFHCSGTNTVDMS